MHATRRRDRHKLIVGAAGLGLGGLMLWYGITEATGKAPVVGSALVLMGIFMVVDAISDLRSYARQRRN